MKVSELREKDLEGLTKELEAQLKEQFTLRMQNASGQLGQVHTLKAIKKDIARIKTVMTEKVRGNA